MIRIAFLWMLFGAVLHWTNIIDVSWWAITLPWLILMILRIIAVSLQEWANSK